MTNAITGGNAGTPITLVLCKDFDQWLSSRADNIKAWVSANQFQGKGSILIPDANGGIEQIVQGIESLENFYLASDLAQTLPSQSYRLDLGALAEISDLAEDDLNLIAYRFYVSWGLSAYKYQRYLSEKSKHASICIDDKELEQEVSNTIDSLCLTRDLINTPASDMMPQDLSLVAKTLAEQYKGSFSEIIGDDLLNQNYPMIHAVGRASVNAPRLLDLRWGDEHAPKVTLVGKGVCFDSGGLNIKTGNFMRQMKKDMGGAAHVLGLAKLIMSQNLPLNLRVLIPAVENAISGDAFRPGDVIPTRKGLTVEIDNTDAEGRLVLCDALYEASEEEPELIIDFATLTGACRVALGTELPGFFCNDEGLAQGLNESATVSADPIWRLPLHKPYLDMLKSNVADTANSSDVGYGGAITAALYLEKFINQDVPWAHFDVMAWNIRKLPGRPVGGEALGLRAVYEYLKQRFA
jgi:leucyl aminopeptidase